MYVFIDAVLGASGEKGFKTGGFRSIEKGSYLIYISPKYFMCLDGGVEVERVRVPPGSSEGTLFRVCGLGYRGGGQESVA